MNDVYNLWANDYRYASEARLRSELTARKLYCGVKGDVLKGALPFAERCRKTDRK